MDFQWSSLLLLLLLLPVPVVVYVWSLRRRRRSGVRYSSLALVREAEPGSSRLRRHLPFALFIAALAALVFAMARPVAVVAVPTNQTTIILTIDVSGSMCSTDIPPSRLAGRRNRGRFVHQQPVLDDAIGIVAFSSFAEVVQAPTSDRTALIRSTRQPRDRTAEPESATASWPRSTPSRRSTRASPRARPTRPRGSRRRPCPRATTPPTSSSC